MDSKILKSADRNKPAAFRETIALMFTLMANEAVIKAHLGKVLILTDCIGLGYIFRFKDTSSKLLEVALYVGTFDKIFVRYSQGSLLFLADLLTRQFNKIFSEDEQSYQICGQKFSLQ